MDIPPVPVVEHFPLDSITDAVLHFYQFDEPREHTKGRLERAFIWWYQGVCQRAMKDEWADTDTVRLLFTRIHGSLNLEVTCPAGSNRASLDGLMAEGVVVTGEFSQLDAPQLGTLLELYMFAHPEQFKCFTYVENTPFTMTFDYACNPLAQPE